MSERSRRRRGVAAGLGLAGAVGLAVLGGCGDAEPAPVVDRFQPSRPTPPGALADAVRSAADRGAAAGGQGPDGGLSDSTGATRSAASGRDPGRFDAPRARSPLQAASILPPDPVVVKPEPLGEPQRDAVERYLSLLARLNLELAAAGGQRSQAAVARVSPVVDELRGTLDALLSLSAGQRLTVEREYGVRQRGLEDELESKLESLRSEGGLAPLVTLVGDLPSLE